MRLIDAVAIDALPKSSINQLKAIRKKLMRAREKNRLKINAINDAIDYKKFLLGEGLDRIKGFKWGMKLK